MDSHAIAQTLDSHFPLPPLHLSHPLTPLIISLVTSLATPLRPFTIPLVPSLLPPRSKEYFERTRAVRFGKSLEDVAAQDATEGCWEEARGPAGELSGLLGRTEGEGPFFLGKQAGYADFVLVGFLLFVGRVDSGGLLERVYGLDGVGGARFRGLVEACGEWVERDT